MNGTERNLLAINKIQDQL